MRKKVSPKKKTTKQQMVWLSHANIKFLRTVGKKEYGTISKYVDTIVRAARQAY